MCTCWPGKRKLEKRPQLSVSETMLHSSRWKLLATIHHSKTYLVWHSQPVLNIVAKVKRWLAYELETIRYRCCGSCLQINKCSIGNVEFWGRVTPRVVYSVTWKFLLFFQYLFLECHSFINPFPFSFLLFIQSTQFYPFIYIRMAFLSSLSQLAKLLLGTLSFYLPEHLPLDSYASCANKHLLSCSLAFFVASLFSNISQKSEDESHQRFDPMSAAGSSVTSLQISFGAHLF